MFMNGLLLVDEWVRSTKSRLTSHGEGGPTRIELCTSCPCIISMESASQLMGLVKIACPSEKHVVM